MTGSCLLAIVVSKTTSPARNHLVQRFFYKQKPKEDSLLRLSRFALLGEFPAVVVDVQPRVPGVLIVDAMHLVDRVEEADDERSAK